MKRRGNTPTPPAPPRARAPLHLSDLLKALKHRDDLSKTRLRDLPSAVRRVSALIGDTPAGILLDLPAIAAKLATISPAAAGMSPKRLSNVRSDFLAAVKESGLLPFSRPAKAPLSAAWRRFMGALPNKRARYGLSRLGRHASARGIAPAEVDDAVIEAFVSTVRDESLHRKPNALHRSVTRIWNEMASNPDSICNASRSRRSGVRLSGLIEVSCPNRSEKTRAISSSGPVDLTYSRKMRVNGRWHLRRSLCAAIKFTPPSPP
jgi:hypothetical protein